MTIDGRKIEDYAPMAELERIKEALVLAGRETFSPYKGDVYRQALIDVAHLAERAAREPVAWKTVPAEPTEKMVSAGVSAEISAPDIIDGKGWHATDFKAAVTLAYKAMLAAAPSQEEDHGNKE